MSKDFKAVISAKSPRYQEWVNVMGTNEFPITTPIPTPASAADIKQGLFYMIDLAELIPEQRERLIQHLAVKFGLDENDVANSLDREGVPVLDEDVTIVIFNPQKWM